MPATVTDPVSGPARDRRSWARRLARLDRRRVGAVVAALWFVVVLVVGPQGSLDAPASRMLAIFGAAVVL